jgi:hypothetical protein
MTLTLYSLHLVALKWGPLKAGYGAHGTTYGLGLHYWLAHVALALAIGWAWRSWQRRGPLEQIVHTLSVVNLPATRPGTRTPAANVD